jgi:hypothetical protein
VSAVSFSSGSLDGLVVANNGDGSIALFEAGSGGLSLISTEFNPALPSPTGLALGALANGTLDVYAATAGREAATLLTFLIGGGAASPLPGGGAVEVPALLPLTGSPLTLISTLLVVTVQTTDIEAQGAETEAADLATAAPSVSIGQSLSTSSEFGEMGDEGEEVVEKVGLPAASAIRSRETSDIDKALEQLRREMLGEDPPADGRGDNEAAPPAPNGISARFLGQEGETIDLTQSERRPIVHHEREGCTAISNESSPDPRPALGYFIPAYAPWWVFHEPRRHRCGQRWESRFSSNPSEPRMRHV